MAKSFTQGPGAFLPTTDIFDTQQIYELDINSTEFKEFLVRIRQSINDIALVVNIKDSAFYSEQEFVNSQVFFPNPTLSSTTAQNPVQRQVFRKVINFGTLPNNATQSINHGITVDANFTFTRMYGCASNPGTAFVAIPNSDIKLTANATQVTITTTSAYVGYSTTYVILEYIKQ